MQKHLQSALIYIFCLTSLQGFSQQQAFGLIFNEEDFAKIPRMPEQTSGSKSLDNIPLSKDLMAYAPTPSQQGKIQSCVSWATAYYAYSIQYAVQHKITDRVLIDKIALSAMYPYKKLRPGCEAGLDIFEIAAFMKNQGNLLYDEFSSNVCDQKVPGQLHPIFPVKDFQAVFDYKKDPGNQGVQAVLRALAYNDLPVVVGMQVGEYFRHLKATEKYYDPKKEGINKFGHAMTIVGYDLRKNAFKILNTWGEKWGQKGCFWIKFEDFSTVAKAGLILILPDEKPVEVLAKIQNAEVGGVFGFQYLDSGAQDFIRTSVTHSGNGLYKLDKGDWKVGQAFQLLTNNSRSGLSMCVFSVSSSGKLTVHWPREKDFGMGTGDKLPVKNFDMVIPGPEDALQIQEKGSDYLCVLYSDHPLIEDLPGIVSRFQSSSGAVPLRIRQGLGSRLIAAENIRYESKEMRFSASSSQGDTVPLILQIDSTDK